MKDLVIGYAEGYDFTQLEPWIGSLRLSGFKGDCWLIGRALMPETRQECADYGVEVIPVLGTSERPTVDRFQALAALGPRLLNYRTIIATDVRDVVFQADPSEWLSQHGRLRDLIVSQEGIRYGDHPWNAANMRDSFGELKLRQLIDQPVCNAGVIAARPALMLELCAEIYKLCQGSTDPIPDQAAYNILVRERYAPYALFTGPDDGWACQAAAGKILRDGGTTVTGATPLFEESLVKTGAGRPYTIVHQYDRVEAWRPAISQRYSLPIIVAR